MLWKWNILGSRKKKNRCQQSSFFTLVPVASCSYKSARHKVRCVMSYRCALEDRWS
jgi:hypothetical protein